MYFIPIMLSLALLVFTIRPFTVLFHELGHAIPFMLMTGKGVSIYIGSFADVNRQIKIPCGRLTVFLTPNPFTWQKGLCIPATNDLSISKQIWYVLNGSVFSVFIAVLFFVCAFYFDGHGLFKTICIFALGSSLFDLVANLIPRSFFTKDGKRLYTDGAIILDLLRRKKYPAFQTGLQKFHEGKYAESARLFQDCIDEGYRTEDTFRSLWYGWIFARDYDKALAAFQSFQKSYTLTAGDWYNCGFMFSSLKMSEKAIEALRHAITLDPHDTNALNNLGYELNNLERFEEAILYCDKAIESTPEHAFAYNNRGLAKIETGKFDEGFQDIKRSLELNESNSYAHRNLGIYYLKTGMPGKALVSFGKAQQLDPETPLLNEYIEKAKVAIP